MLTGDLKSKIDQIWNAFWSGGIANPIEVIEQITYLLFLRRLDDLHTLEENKAVRLGTPLQRRIFPEGLDPRGRPYEALRWSRFKNQAPADMFTVVGEHVFPFLRTLGASGASEGSTYAHHMKDARFTIPTPALLAKVVDLLDAVPLEDRDTKGEGSPELTRSRTAQSFCVPKADIAANGYDLSLNRYKEVVHEPVQHRAPAEILAELVRLEDEIARGMRALEGLLK
ncbi:type I restriction-modification system subunit M N-terminal domain-containing protein [Ramlibacter sp. 2FC]|uniref:type I restriction-modification system subunit M N-terminal domain-containing protein n=1 Tax=Ramlibacter sp. 2FC TaxID=2502188 RepID=UPI0010F7DF3C|nr:type I restriction-modification system subunit M N-terminal domain-containing protein [Ramlibacter sp. 2FC]